METYGGRLSTSTRSRAVKNSHGTSAAMLLKEEKYLDKLKCTSQRSLGREEEKFKRRLENLDKAKSASRHSYLDQEDDVDISPESLQAAGRVRSRHERGSLQLESGKSGSSFHRRGSDAAPVPLSNPSTRRESLNTQNMSQRRHSDDFGRARERSMSLASGSEKKSVTFSGGNLAAKARLHMTDNHMPQIVPFIHVTDEENAESQCSLDSAVNAKPGECSKSSTTGGESGSRGNVKNLYSMAMRTSDDKDTVTASSDSHKEEKRQQPASFHEMRGRRASTGSSHVSKATLDLKALKELEEILKDTRLYTTKKSKQLGPESSSLRIQKKRMQQLEQLLTSLKPGQKKEPAQPEFDPMDMLNCSYLRLSKHNVEALEQMVRDSGRDPGIHPHSDVTDFNLFADDESSKA